MPVPCLDRSVCRLRCSRFFVTDQWLNPVHLVCSHPVGESPAGWSPFLIKVISLFYSGRFIVTGLSRFDYNLIIFFRYLSHRGPD